ncbi:hypothetical protein GCM10010412_081560 [Nonomuraea recticatena]|uniref:Band 7 domain-containing protein n=1 Tax=Nonomuraea recticatena TaxID=46178 RepID=A0ABN3T1K6_9ACTN
MRCSLARDLEGLELMIDSQGVGWGMHIGRVEIKDVALPETMKRSMSRQAEAERERRSRVITAEGELQASQKLAQAAETMTEHPAALQLRLLQTVVEVAAEKNCRASAPPGGVAPLPGTCDAARCRTCGSRPQRVHPAVHRRAAAGAIGAGRPNPAGRPSASTMSPPATCWRADSPHRPRRQGPAGTR